MFRTVVGVGASLPLRTMRDPVTTISCDAAGAPSGAAAGACAAAGMLAAQIATTATNCCKENDAISPLLFILCLHCTRSVAVASIETREAGDPVRKMLHCDIDAIQPIVAGPVAALVPPGGFLRSPSWPQKPRRDGAGAGSHHQARSRRFLTTIPLSSAKYASHFRQFFFMP